MQTVTIKLDYGNGLVDEQVKAWRYGKYLAVHKQSGLYALTHLPTGKQILSRVYLRDARSFAKKFAELGDLWDFTEEQYTLERKDALVRQTHQILGWELPLSASGQSRSTSEREGGPHDAGD